MGLIVPALSVSGGLLVRLRGGRRPRARLAHLRRRHPAFAATATLLALSAFRFAQEIVFLVSLTVICLMLRRVMGTPGARGQAAHRGRRHHHLRLPRRADAGRGLPLVRHGPAGLRRDASSACCPHGHRRRTCRHVAADRRRGAPARHHGAALADGSCRLPVPAEPAAGRTACTSGRERVLGFGARSIALIDEAAQSPLALLATVPLLALIAVHAPAEQRATWFALIASLMSLAIVASQLITKYLNLLFPDRPRRLRPAALAGAGGGRHRRDRCRSPSSWRSDGACSLRQAPSPSALAHKFRVNLRLPPAFLRKPSISRRIDLPCEKCPRLSGVYVAAS